MIDPKPVSAKDRFDAFLARLPDFERTSERRARGKCPVCGTNALSVTHDDVGVGVKCHGPDVCWIEEIVESVDLTMSDLFASDPLGERSGVRRFDTKALTALCGDDPLRPRLFMLEFFDITGSIEGALILHQILHLASLDNGGVDMLGYHWIWMRHEDWWDELRIKKSTAGRTTRHLEALGLIRVYACIVGGFRRTNHYRVVPEVLVPMLIAAREAVEPLTDAS